jgi:L-histidine Nalpha-methyltransferase
MEQKKTITEFERDVLQGLSASPRYLSSKYFYNHRGSKIFEDIMRMPEYYLTDCELEIFATQKQEILDSFDPDSHFEMIELGAGDGTKTKILLSHFLKKQADFSYIPIDISEEAMKKLITNLDHEIPGFFVNGQVGDYFKLIGNLNGSFRKVILFLGSNIGNFNEEKSRYFLNHLRSVLNIGDMVFIGFDLKKDPEVILNAYNDPHGHTAAFNLNLLQRINDELDAHFDLEAFYHQEIYDEQTGTARSFLVSKKSQTVHISKLDRYFHFDAGEQIFMEMSQKYDIQTINDLAKNSGFGIVNNFFDSRSWFVNSLWELKK